ncbi:MAG: hypothetical protein JXB48_21235 [Candidatus Latescibacteria bacterium]|nr:hypothetical protein [Candidatus Latescibacterota bacterium]
MLHFVVKRLVLIFAIVVSAICQYNYSGYKDTAGVIDFNADSSGFTKALELSQYENMRVSVMANDTSSSGYASDSIFFQWGIQLGDVVINSSGIRDTTWLEKILVDTFDIATSGNLVVPVKTPDSLGYCGQAKLFIDTSNVTGYAVQNRAVFPYWSPVFRFWYSGLTGNITGSYVRLIFAQTRRLYNYVHNQ